MPKEAANLLGTDRELRAARSKGARTDFRIRGAPGLQLRVTDTGTKSWALAYKSPLTGKWAKVALGRYPDVGLAEAKGLAQDVAGDVRRGQDPVHDRREIAMIGTFDELAARYMNEHLKRNARSGKESRSSLEARRILNRDILPILGSMRADAVNRSHVMTAVETVADRGAYVASDRVLGLLRAIYNWANATGRLESNPTLGLKRRNAARPKTRVLSGAEIAILWRLAESDGVSITRPVLLAIKLQLATGARIGEAIAAPRSEFDLERGLWTIPADRTKSGREHVLPLSPLAMKVIREALALGDEQEARRAARAGLPVRAVEWLFPASKGGQMMDAKAASRAIVRERQYFQENGLSAPFNTHDLRRTVATHMGELGIADETIERVLNHAPRTVAGRHYNHSRNLQFVKEALFLWSDRVSDYLEVGPTVK